MEIPFFSAELHVSMVVDLSINYNAHLIIITIIASINTMQNAKLVF